MTSQEGSSLLKSCARSSFSFTCDNLQAFATHPHSLGDPWFEKHCCNRLFFSGVSVSMAHFLDLFLFCTKDLPLCFFSTL